MLGYVNKDTPKWVLQRDLVQQCAKKFNNLLLNEQSEFTSDSQRAVHHMNVHHILFHFYLKQWSGKYCVAVNIFRLVLRNWLINSRTQVSQSLQKRERKIEVFWELHYESLLLQKILQSSRHKIKTDHNNFLNAHSWSYCAQFIILKKKIRIWNNFLFGWCQIMIKLSTLHSQKYIWQQIKQIKWVISTF